MLTSYPDEQVMLEAVLAGGAGFVLKDITGLDLVAAVRTVSSGRSLLDPQAAAELFERVRDRAAGGRSAGRADRQ